MLNYMGPAMGQSTVAGSLPSGVPGTQPAAVPGVTPLGAVGSISPMGNRIPSRPVIPSGPVPPALQQAITQSTPPPPAQEPAGPEDQEYDTLTQEDGTVVLFLKNADGSRGPAVKIIQIKGKVGRPA